MDLAVQNQQFHTENTDQYTAFQVIARRRNPSTEHWEYQVVYEIDNNQTSLSDYLKSNHNPLEGEKWRCRNCTLNIPPNWSALNDAENVLCKECGKSRDEAGFCPWIRIETMPIVHQQATLKRYDSSLERIMHLVWPSFFCNFGDNKPPSI